MQAAFSYVYPEGTVKLHYADDKSSHPEECKKGNWKGGRGSIWMIGIFGPQSLPERQLEKKLMAGCWLSFLFLPSHFIVVEEQVFVHVLSKETGLHQQRSSS